MIVSNLFPKPHFTTCRSDFQKMEGEFYGHFATLQASLDAVAKLNQEEMTPFLDLTKVLQVFRNKAPLPWSLATATS